MKNFPSILESCVLSDEVMSKIKGGAGACQKSCKYTCSPGNSNQNKNNGNFNDSGNNNGKNTGGGSSAPAPSRPSSDSTSRKDTTVMRPVCDR